MWEIYNGLINLSTGSIVGIVLSSICIISVIVLKQIDKNKDKYNDVTNGNRIKLICSIIELILAVAIIVIICFANIGFVSFKNMWTLGTSYLIACFLFVFVFVLFMIYAIINSLLIEESKNKNKITFSIIMVCFMVIYFFIIILGGIIGNNDMSSLMSDTGMRPIMIAILIVALLATSIVEKNY